MKEYLSILVAIVIGVLLLFVLQNVYATSPAYQAGVDDSINITVKLYGSARSTRVEFSGTDEIGNIQRWSELVYHEHEASAVEIRDMAIDKIMERVAMGDKQMHGFFKALRKDEI